MRKRTQARELALQLLYQAEMTGSPPEEVLESYVKGNPPLDPEVQGYAARILRGTGRHLALIDQLISKYAEHWDLKRMAVIDRNILRFASYEILFLSEEIPLKVAINEAVNIAKKYSQEESGKFVNGILDKINHTEPRLKEETLPGESSNKEEKKNCDAESGSVDEPGR